MEKLLGLFGYGLKILIRHQEPLLFGNRQIDNHTSDLLDILLVLIRTDKLLDIFIDAIADLVFEIWVVFNAVWDEMLSLQLVQLPAFCCNISIVIQARRSIALRDLITLLIAQIQQNKRMLSLIVIQARLGPSGNISFR